MYRQFSKLLPRGCLYMTTCTQFGTLIPDDETYNFRFHDKDERRDQYGTKVGGSANTKFPDGNARPRGGVNVLMDGRGTNQGLLLEEPQDPDAFDPRKTAGNKSPADDPDLVEHYLSSLPMRQAAHPGKWFDEAIIKLDEEFVFDLLRQFCKVGLKNDLLMDPFFDELDYRAGREHRVADGMFGIKTMRNEVVGRCTEADKSYFKYAGPYSNAMHFQRELSRVSPAAALRESFNQIFTGPRDALVRKDEGA